MSVLPVTLANRVIQGDCVDIMRGMAPASVDFILTDPPYLVNYHARDGRTVANDDDDGWLCPAFAEMYRVLKPDALCMTFYGWPSVGRFAAAWERAGFRVVGHLAFSKKYASSTGFLQHRHESAYLLAKGHPPRPWKALPDMTEWRYTGNRFHPTQKSSTMLAPFVRSFCKPGGLVLDPFCGAGASLLAARDCDRRYLGIELDPRHALTATLRLETARIAA